MARKPFATTILQHPAGTLPGMATSAAALAALGWLLMQGADWPARQVVTGLAGFALLGLAILVAAAWHLRGSAFGWANQITLLRSALACLAAGTLVAGGHAHLTWSLAAVVGVALSLDAVDGWLARRLHLASRFGARFDLEIDALTILILSLLVWQSGRAGPWVLAIGGMRYGFVALGWIWPAARAPLPPSRRRKAVCGLLGVLLLVCMLPPTPPWLAAAAAALALVSLLASFATDLIWLARRPRGATKTAPGLIEAGIPAYSRPSDLARDRARPISKQVTPARLD